MGHRVTSTHYPVSDTSSEEEQETIEWSSAEEEEEPVEWPGDEVVEPMSPTGTEVSRHRH